MKTISRDITEEAATVQANTNNTVAPAAEGANGGKVNSLDYGGGHFVRNLKIITFLRTKIVSISMLTCVYFVKYSICHTSYYLIMHVYTLIASECKRECSPIQPASLSESRIYAFMPVCVSVHYLLMHTFTQPGTIDTYIFHLWVDRYKNDRS
jgi:hypothetical protein